MKKIAILMALALASFSLAATTPVRTGPVSQYGKLQAGLNASNHGRIFGSCPTYNNVPVKVRGMSLYWSVHSNATEFYNDDAVSKMVQDMKIEVIRIPVATDEDCWSGDCSGGYIKDAAAQKALVDKVVQSAVKNDIYVIIDWHSHTANNQLSNAKDFFGFMAQQYGNLNNVIFEVFNEPIAQDWGTIKTYADQVIAEIRKYSSNLVLVGSRSYDQYPNEAIDNPISDDNVAYTFHYYANSHDKNREGANAVAAIKAGLPVFVSEWGTANANGGGEPGDYANNQWQQWLDDYDLSAANWSASRIGEGTAAFTAESNRSNFSYTTSGTMVKNYLSSNPSSYTACGGTTTSSSSVASSASEGNPLIDDFEDGNGIANTGLEDFWYAYTDVGNKGASTIGNDLDDEDNYIVVFPSAAADGSGYGAGLTDIVLRQGQNENDPYVALGLDVSGGLAGCRTITYRYRGAAHSFKVVMEGDGDEDNDGVSDLTGWNRHKGTKTGTTTWKTATYIVPGDLAQESGWGINVDLDISKVIQLQWEVTSTTTADYFYIDDLKCEGMDIVPVVIPDDESSSSTKPNSSSSSVKVSSSSHVNPTCEDGETIDAGTVLMVCVDGEWTAVPVSSASSTDVVVIDALDDGNNGVEVFGEDGYWFIYEAGGTVSNDQDADGTWDLVRGNSTNYYAAMQGITGISYNDDSYPSVGMAIHVSAAGLGGCSAIQYDYKGSGHMFRAAMNRVTPEAGYEHVTAAQNLSTGWTTVTVNTSDLKQPTWVKNASPSDVVDFAWDDVYQIVWIVDEKIRDAQRSTELDIDNVKCVGTLPSVASSSSGAVQQSSSSVAACVEGQEIVAGGSHVKCVNGKWVDMTTGSSSSASTPGYAVIDDFEDGNNQSESLGEAYWYIYEAGGSVTNTEDKKTGWDMLRTEGSNGYAAMEGISGITYGATTYPSVGMGVDIPTSAFANCTAITYEYKGSAHKFRAAISTVTPDKGYEHITDIMPKATTWTPVTVTASDLSQPTWIPATAKKTFSWSLVSKLAWVVDQEIPNADRGTELDIDNVQCVGTLPTPKSSSSGSNIRSSSSGVISIAAAQVAPGLSVSLQDNTLVVNVAKAGLVKVQVFDMMGHVMERHSESMAAGSFAHSFKALPKGMYVVRVQQGSAAKTLRMQVR